MVQLGMVTFDTENAREIAAWWAARLGGEITADMDGWYCIVSAPGVPVNLGFQKIDDPTPGKNRIHLDLTRPADSDRDALIAEWVAAGATHLGRRGEEGFAWDTLADPDGNQFCIADPD